MKQDHTANILFLIFGIYGLVFSVQLPLGWWNRPGPGVFPLCLSIILCLSAVVGLITVKRTGEGRLQWRELISKSVTPLKILGVTAAFIAALYQLGYLLTASLYLFVLLYWVSRYRLYISLGLAIALAVGSSIFFEKLLALQLPKGFLVL